MSPLDRFRQVSTEKFIPLQASLELTNRCNERCTHCYLPHFTDDPERVLELEDWQKVLSELRRAGSLFVILMGGEPMLSRFFWQIAEHSTQMGFHTSMITNGTKISNPSIAERLAKVGIANLTFSLYSPFAHVHDGMTSVRGSHSKTVRAIELCLEAGLDVSVNCLLTHENIGGVFELEDWCLERNIPLKVDPMVTPKLDGDLAPTLLRPTYLQVKWFYTERARRWKKGLPVPALEQSSSYVCNAAKGKCAVTAYGELLPCIEIREPMGLLLEQSFDEIWLAKSAEKWRSLVVGQLRDYPLEKGQSFCEHCPGMAKNEDGDPLQVSRYARRLAEIKRDVLREFGALGAR